MSERLDLAKVISEQLSGTGIRLEDIIEAKKVVDKDYDKWDDSDIIAVLDDLLKRAKPMLIVANKADMPTSDENIKRLEDKIWKCNCSFSRIRTCPYTCLRSRVNKLFPG